MEANPMNNNPAAQANDPVNWNDFARQVRSREDLVHLVRALHHHLREKPDEWENRDLASFLEAMATWVEDLEGYYRNKGETVPEQPSWNMLGQILLAAKVYE